MKPARWKYAITDGKAHWVAGPRSIAVCGTVTPTGTVIADPPADGRCAECVNVLAGPAEGIGR